MHLLDIIIYALDIVYLHFQEVEMVHLGISLHRIS